MTAPAKVNLALHITGQREDGYHLMDSLVAFTDAGDRIDVEAAETDEIVVSGPFAAHVPIGGGNLIARARDLLRGSFGAGAPVRLHLEKNLPVASGVGGGSSDAATALRLLCTHWGIPANPATLSALGLRLGADLPMCLAARPLMARGIGDAIEELPRFPPLPLVLVNPGIPLATADVFSALEKRDNAPLPALEALEALDDIAGAAAWLNMARNDLEPAARSLVPQVGEVLEALADAGALTARMSGSGATCFGIFPSLFMARRAEKTLGEAHPDWFILATETQAAEA
ncbi:4-(cytidine 5'-diphospho)-2-C-methyl-D-erythritol kinase [Nitratireductor pacificus]|uniref:4-diphosphocytidyl-2-C-methyl-D-erythritol kinase n=1 Tax=Nitratireductor pacificus pht-3B TaxID=391937 RepID=K2N6Z3_9HYPH|nr:4-(cytidine 5'-diphospho)-2-C-methyl-D-erythritol kinase [Nitratireductor pacificus]EKF19918.1 4-diphosphocytidyl-2-C-methyl-D-erythritol kinase [Nitratireductor pacificus pht-3B]